MGRLRKKRRLLAVAALLLAVAAVALVIAFRDEIFPESSPARRGARLAEEAGCFSCHGRAQSGAPNPSQGKPADEFSRLPSLFAQRLSIAEMRQWIANGISDEKKQSQAYMASRENEALRMPAYREHLSVEQIDEIIAYLALEQYRIEASGSLEALPEGERLARRFACFSCHGELGQGGLGNLDSLKGYIPGFFGDDFEALTGDAERRQVLEWIRDGASREFLETRFLGFYPGRYFSERQAIEMPGYGEHMSGEQLQALTDYVIELHELGPMTARDLLKYRPIGTAEAEGDEAPPAGDSAAARNSDADFALFYQVKPVLKRCLNCHGPSDAKSEFRMDTRERFLRGGEISEFMERSPAVPGKPGESMLITFVQAEEEDPYNEIYPMPPKGEPLTDEQIELLKNWIRAGVPWPEGEVLLPPEDDESTENN